ncbi:hypothetical protein N7541_000606 [Penicillium brevicompactum]|uniref:Uncharacterized protein n=1 Tax=Penicillium brevicompactum TaxID=5074 RepID=A0A9W9RUL3_PENBR|nr:hypothetical protein N7541_000606 [Penicillium brevicompactum]
MSYYKPDHVYDASLALNVPDDLWEIPDTLNCLGVNETMFFTQANIDAFVQQQDVVMENGCFEFEACPEPSKVPMGTELYSGGQVELPSSSPSSTHSSEETEATLRTDKELSIILKRFTSTINQFGILSQTLGTKIEDLNSRFDNMQHGLENMDRHLSSIEHRMESMEHRMDSLYQGMESLEAKFKTVNEYLLEVIRREQMVMRELGDLASRYHERDI